MLKDPRVETLASIEKARVPREVVVTKANYLGVIEIPSYKRLGDAGFDLSTIEDIIIKPQETKLIRTGLQMIIPDGFELQIRPRSGLALKTQLIVANSPATIDSGFRDEIMIIIKNSSCLTIWERAINFIRSKLNKELDLAYIVSKRPNYKGTYRISSGTRIAQGVLAKFEIADFRLVERDEFAALSTNDRGGGLGSTGVTTKS